MSLHDFHRVQERLKAVADPISFLVNLFAHAPVGFAVWTATGSPLLTNTAFMDLFGSEPPPEYNVLEDDVLAGNGLLALFQRAFAGETVHVPTFWYDPRELKTITVRDGRRVAISMTIFPLFKSDGEIEYVAATYKNDTEIALAQDQLRGSEERQRLAQSAAHVGTFEWNVQTGVTLWSVELERMYGLGPGEFARTQQSWATLVHPEDRAAAVAGVKAASATLSPTEREWRVIWPDGTVHWLVGRFQMFLDDHGKPDRLIGVNLDITARKKAEVEFRRLNDDLERLVQERTAQLDAANRELEAFSYSVAHDLRAPLRGIRGYAQILVTDFPDLLDAEALTCVRKIQDSAVMMGQLIDALLGLAQVVRTELQPAWTNLSTLARTIADRLTAAEPARSPEVTVQPGLTALIDPALARILLENLLGNAWKYTGKAPSPRVEVAAVDHAGSRAFLVRDNGVGFNMAHADKLFTPFQRLHSASDFPGTGIGLATAHRIVSRHGGRMWAEARPGEGATFYFTLP